jgi:inorganic pyrophosphatase
MKLHKLPARTKDGFHVVVESPRGSRVKLEYDPKLGVFLAGRPLPLGYTYPYDWGFIPGTKAPDGDPYDALVYWDVPSTTGTVLPCRLIGVLELEQREHGEEFRNDRIIAVPLKHHRSDHVRSVKELSKRIRDDLCNFFTSSVYSSSKKTKVVGWGGPKAAEALIDGGES